MSDFYGCENGGMGSLPCVEGSFYFCFSLECENFLGSSEVLEDMFLAGRVVL